MCIWKPGLWRALGPVEQPWTGRGPQQSQGRGVSDTLAGTCLRLGLVSGLALSPVKVPLSEDLGQPVCRTHTQTRAYRTGKQPFHFVM